MFFLYFNKKNHLLSFKEIVVFARFWPIMSTFKTRVAALVDCRAQVVMISSQLGTLPKQAWSVL
jgi:hypothetical protein